ncbi:LysR family transcriptional regulator [Pseudomonas sp. LPB0260]|uniref:LysR family transcriptional regulator n=1 Tax=Pseudomonas sp. LPB0260 TaxID=2614442 RepID=UPI0015C2AA17|nr:LysR family transcriptional regulator [Pseudomonas sp. LPB0260]QLC73956.1 LysR family transcriptional regulator [Pseudomonas sp. LPB0260]QLC76730.1 LysR family transcriptional regulator [Pseudomonas sp. LPB0260]
MLPALDLELIRTFQTVLQEGGFKPAAERLNKTPAAVSMQIKRLEELLGQRLLERSNQGIALTAAGDILKEKGEKLLGLNYELLSDLRQGELFGKLSFGTPTDYAPTLLQKLLPIFGREFPKLTPTIILEPSRSLRARIQSGALDMAIVAQEPGTDEGAHLWSEEIAWFGSARTQDGKAKVGVLTTNCILRDRALEDLKTVPREHKLVLEAATVASLRDGVEEGFCQAFLPVSMAGRLVRSKEIRPSHSLMLNFVLIAGVGADGSKTHSVASKFRRALLG